MRKLATIKMTQRTATGSLNDPRDKTKIYVYCTDDGYPGLLLTTEKDSYMTDWYRGYIVVDHPALMCGSWEENVADFKNACEKKLVTLGLVTENKWGMFFWNE